MKQKLGVTLVPLDFQKLKAFFKQETPNETHICATLQALRWRVTRVGPSMRRQILMSYIHFDLLEIAGSPGQGAGKSVFDTLYHSESMKVKEYLIAFLNSLASEY